MSNTTIRVGKILRDEGPNLSSTVAKRLERCGLSPTAARQRLSRAVAVGEIRKLTDLRFPHNETFLYLEDQNDTPQFWGRLIDALDTTESVYGLAIQSLIARGGAVPKKQFDSISGSPLRLKGHLSNENVLRTLQKIHMVIQPTWAGAGDIVMINPDSPYDVKPTPARLKARLLAESILLSALRDWSRKVGLVSYEKVQLRGDESPPQFGQFTWDLTAPSYTQPLVSYQKGSKPKPGFFVADVVLGGRLTQRQVRYFLRKCSVMRGVKNTRPFLAMLVAEWFEPDALTLAKREGILATTPENLFGAEVAKAIKALLDTLTNAAAVAVRNPEVIDQLFSKLSSIEGAAGNIRGPLFEMIVGHCVREKEGNTIDIGKEVQNPETGDKAEIDVLRVKEKQEVCCYECKGHGPNVRVSRDEVEKWLTKTIPTIRSYIKHQERFQNIKEVYEFWTTGVFDEDAVALLRERQAHTKKYTITWRDKGEVEKYVRGIRATYLAKILNEHYFNHPLAKASERKPRLPKLSQELAGPMPLDETADVIISEVDGASQQ